ncbi:MAG: topoisomerase [Gaiellales bacterium]|nr:topoisomerase [Gaiellales bacterium]
MYGSRGGASVRRGLSPEEAAAEAAGLRYVSDAEPGISRLRAGGGFTYRTANGSLIPRGPQRDRITALAIPPAWTSVWISPRGNGHLQATGRDARGRKQYRYHPEWRRQRDDHKYGRLADFGGALRRIRARSRRDLALPGLPREKVLAGVILLLDTTLMRVGNAEYARLNKSFGVTTIRNHHADVTGASITFTFRGKSGTRHEVAIDDRRLARLVRRCQQLPGQELFAYLDADGEPRDVGSGDVNEYLREIAGGDFSAKDFRTWGGTVLAAEALCQVGRPTSEADSRGRVAEAVRMVAAELRNTPAVCRASYIHPLVIEAYLQDALPCPAIARNPERALLQLLRDGLPAAG